MSLFIEFSGPHLSTAGGSQSSFWSTALSIGLLVLSASPPPAVAAERQMQPLQRAQAAPRLSSAGSSADIAQLQTRVAELEGLVQRLSEMVRIEGDDLVLEAPRDVRLEARRAVRIESNGDVLVRGRRDVRIEADRRMALESVQQLDMQTASLSAQAKASASVTAGATIDFKAALVRSNGAETVNTDRLQAVPVVGVCPPTGGPLLGGKILLQLPGLIP